MSLFLNRVTAVLLTACGLAVCVPSGVSAQPAPPLPDEMTQAQPQEQPPQLPPPTITTTPAASERQLFRTALGTSPFSGTRQRLTRAPDMFGDSLLPGPGLLLREPTNSGGVQTSTLRLIQPGGGGFKISDNGEVLPTDRVWFNYNFFKNGLGIQSRGGSTSDDVSRYNLGLEKTFCDGAVSLEFRLPITSGEDSALNRPALGPLVLRTGDMGNLTVVSKSLVYQDAHTAVGAGLAFESPTGDDVFVLTPSTGAFQVDNQAYLLHPFLGVTHVTDDDRFYYSYLQFTFPVSEHDAYQIQNAQPTFLGEVDPLSLVQFDLGLGKWLYRDIEGNGITGVAPIAEMHYVSTLKDVQHFSNALPTPVYTLRDSFQSLNFTAGVHVEICGYSMLRLAAVLPALGEDFRTFDTEIQAMYTVHY